MLFSVRLLSLASALTLLFTTPPPTPAPPGNGTPLPAEARAQEMYQNPNLKLLSVDGVAPSPQSIGDRSYPLVNDFFVAIRTDEPEDSPARLLRDWLLTNTGRQTITDAGYVAIG